MVFEGMPQREARLLEENGNGWEDLKWHWPWKYGKFGGCLWKIQFLMEVLWGMPLENMEKKIKNKKNLQLSVLINIRVWLNCRLFGDISKCVFVDKTDTSNSKLILTLIIVGVLGIFLKRNCLCPKVSFFLHFINYVRFILLCSNTHREKLYNTHREKLHKLFIYISSSLLTKNPGFAPTLTHVEAKTS
jgi:hypothetical protein